MPNASTVIVTDVDPELSAELDATELSSLRSRARARIVRFPRGELVIDPEDFEGRGSLGLLVVDGLLVRKVSVGPRACAELLGPGDLLQPWLQVGVDGSVPIEVDWTVAAPLTVAVLDRAFAAAVAPWPEFATTVTARVMARSHWLAFQLAVCHIRSVEERLILMLWHIADRWGKVTPDGVQIPIRLPHSLLGYMIGARRPAVTLGLNRLQQAGSVERLGRSRYLLVDDPPASYHQIHSEAGHRRLTPCHSAAE